MYWPLYPSVTLPISLNLRQVPYPSVVIQHIWVLLQRRMIKQRQAVLKLSNREIHPSDPPRIVFPPLQKRIQLSQKHPKIPQVLQLSLLKTPRPSIPTINQLNILSPEIPIHPVSHRQPHLLVYIPAQKLGPARPMHHIHNNSLAFGQHSLPVDQVWHVDEWVTRVELLLVQVEPASMIVCVVFDLLVGRAEVLEHQADFLCVAADCPVAEFQDRGLHAGNGILLYCSEYYMGIRREFMTIMQGR